MCTKDKCCSEPGESKQRQAGFYWVKTKIYNEWIICDWIGRYWRASGSIQNVQDSDFVEIDERRIERQPKEATGCGCNDVAISRLIDLMLDSGLFTETNRLYDIKNGLEDKIINAKKNEIINILRSVRDMLGRQLPVDTSYDQLDNIIADKIIELK